jgi:hypothetical protein
MSNEKQTAVQWLVSQQKHNQFFDIETIEIAKEMEKEQIVKAFENGDWNYHYSRKTGNDFENGEEYFEEIYGGNK